MNRLILKLSCALRISAVVVPQSFKTLAAVVSVEVTARYQHTCRVNAIFNREARHYAKRKSETIGGLSAALAGPHFLYFKVVWTVVGAVGVALAVKLVDVVREPLASVLLVIDDVDLTAPD